MFWGKLNTCKIKIPPKWIYRFLPWAQQILGRNAQADSKVLWRDKDPAHLRQSWTKSENEHFGPPQHSLTTVVWHWHRSRQAVDRFHIYSHLLFDKSTKAVWCKVSSTNGAGAETVDTWVGKTKLRRPWERKMLVKGTKFQLDKGNKFRKATRWLKLTAVYSWKLLKVDFKCSYHTHCCLQHSMPFDIWATTTKSV